MNDIDLIERYLACRPALRDAVCALRAMHDPALLGLLVGMALRAGYR